MKFTVRECVLDAILGFCVSIIIEQITGRYTKYHLEYITNGIDSELICLFEGDTREYHLCPANWIIC